MSRKVSWQNIAGHCQQAFENKKFVDITHYCFAFTPQVNFPKIISISLADFGSHGCQQTSNRISPNCVEARGGYITYLSKQMQNQRIKSYWVILCQLPEV